MSENNETLITLMIHWQSQCCPLLTLWLMLVVVDSNWIGWCCELKCKWLRKYIHCSLNMSIGTIGRNIPVSRIVCMYFEKLFLNYTPCNVSHLLQIPVVLYWLFVANDAIWRRRSRSTLVLGNGLLPDDTKPQPDPVDPLAFISG